MKKVLALFAALGFVACGASLSQANLLTNGNLDLTYAQEIVTDFYLPKPASWVNVGSRAIGGPYEDEMSSEPWAGPAPTPVTTDGNANPPHPEGCGGPDCAVFFKPFSGSVAQGAATGHLYQDVAGTAGQRYLLTGWAGGEPNFLGGAVFAIDFLNGGGGLIGSAELDLKAAGLLTDNGQPFDYKQYSVAAVAPAGTTTVRARASMIDAMANPAGGGQAYVVDDFTLTAVPEPATFALVGLAVAGLVGIRRRS
jgi:hypothetical protein